MPTVCQILFWVPAVPLGGREAGSLPTGTARLIRMAGNRGRFANSNSGKYIGPLCKISLEHKVLLFFNKIIGEFLVQHILLVI